MTRSILIVAFLAAAGAPPGAGAPESYTMSCRMLTADNCPVLCPCVFGDGPTYGHCLFAGAAVVEDGMLGETSL